jgi:hypothetical protein
VRSVTVFVRIHKGLNEPAPHPRQSLVTEELRSIVP